MAKIEAEFDGKELRQNLRVFDKKLQRAVGAVVDRRAALTTGWLKANARWTDRTGAARSGLVAIPRTTEKFAEIFMAYSVNYGIWLEVAHNRKWAILGPAIRIQGQLLMEDLNLLITKMEALSSAGGLAGSANAGPPMPPVAHKPGSRAKQVNRNRRRRRP